MSQFISETTASEPGKLTNTMKQADVSTPDFFRVIVNYSLVLIKSLSTCQITYLLPAGIANIGIEFSTLLLQPMTVLIIGNFTFLRMVCNCVSGGLMILK